MSGVKACRAGEYCVRGACIGSVYLSDDRIIVVTYLRDGNISCTGGSTVLSEGMILQ